MDFKHSERCPDPLVVKHWWCLEGTKQVARWKILIWGWHVALSKNNKTCRFCIFILPLKAVNHSSIICDIIHVFLLDLHSTGSFHMSRFRKHGDFAALPITKGFSISPDIKPALNKVTKELRRRKKINLTSHFKSC